MIEILENKPASDLTKEDIVKFKTVLMKMPSNRTKIPAYRDKSITELMSLEIPENDKLSNTTINNNFTKISTFLTWLMNNGENDQTDLKLPLQKVIPKTEADYA